MIRCHCYPDSNDPRQGTGCGGCRKLRRPGPRRFFAVALAALTLGCAYVHQDPHTGLTLGALGQEAIAYHCVGAVDPDTGQQVAVSIDRLKVEVEDKLGAEALREVRLSALPTGGVCYAARGSKISDALRDVVMYYLARGGLDVLESVVGIGSDAVNKK